MACRLTVTDPVDAKGIVDYGTSFRVEGKIECDTPLSDSAVLTVTLSDTSGSVLRRVSGTKGNSKNIFAYHPDLTAMSEQDDPGRKGLIAYGFPELVVKDTENPFDSLKNAEIKCCFDDTNFKAVVVSATDTEHGATAFDGIGFVSEKGEPYTVIPCGDYIITVTLSDGDILSECEKPIHILKQTDRLTGRFNPISHKNRIIAWAHENGYAAIENSLPGYLNPYIGGWRYHMGLLTMYRANDMALYNTDRVHMFVYLIDPTSTSFETELAYLQTLGVVGDRNRFRSYFYDIGEAVMNTGKGGTRKAEIREFAGDEFLHISRIDIVGENAEENRFDISCEAVKESIFDVDGASAEVVAPCRVAVTGVVKPVAFDKKYFSQRKDNTFRVDNRVENVVYEITCDGSTETCTRKLMMERTYGSSIGFSVFEFYNIFDIPSSFRGKTIGVNVHCTDTFGNTLEGVTGFTLKVK